MNFRQFIQSSLVRSEKASKASEKIKNYEERAVRFNAQF